MPAGKGEKFISNAKSRRLNLALTMLVRWNMFAHFRRRSRILFLLLRDLPFTSRSLSFSSLFASQLVFSTLSLSLPLSSSHVPSFALPLFPSFSEKKRCHTHARDARTYLTAYTNPGCLNSLANYFHSVSLFPCISRYQSVCAPRRRY